MSNKRTYLDWNATAQVYPEVVEAVTETLRDGGNASSVHQEGRKARSKIELAREKVAGLVNAPARDIIFTSGGSEANALAIKGLSYNKTVSRCMISGVEHPSLIESANPAAATTTVLAVDANGIVDLSALESELAAAEKLNERVLVSVMWANNETGVVQPINDIVQLAHAHNGLVHSDAVQAVGKVAVDFEASGLDLMSLSAHKIGGPQGTGALVVRPDLPLAAMIKGGGQELKRRAGTENLSGIAGFGVAAELAAQAKNSGETAILRNKLESQIKAIRSDAIIFAEQRERLPNTTCVAISGTNAETLLIMLDLAGFAVSSGSACSSGKVSTSHVLTAMGVEVELAKAAIRISLGWTTTSSDIENFIEAWAKAVGVPCPQKANAAA